MQLELGKFRLSADDMDSKDADAICGLMPGIDRFTVSEFILEDISKNIYNSSFHIAGFSIVLAMYG